MELPLIQHMDLVVRAICPRHDLSLVTPLELYESPVGQEGMAERNIGVGGWGG